MNSVLEVDVRAALALLEVQGIATSAQLQVALGKSQPTVSRLMRLMATQGVVVLGRGRRARYGLGRAILSSAAAQQPIWLIDEHGAVTRWGTLVFLAGNQVHVSHAGTEWLTRDALPWFLSPLRHEGFLGRLWACTTALEQRLGDDPQHWTAEQHLYATLAGIHDSPGALLVGDPHEFNRSDTVVDDAQRVRPYDAIAADVTRYMLPARSSAGGEQPKFLRSRPLDPDDARAWKSDWESLVVKFTPLRGTPFGQRWHDLLHAEALALRTLAYAGEPVAQARVLESEQRTYLESVRFDRVGRHGRRHVVPLDAVHEAFVGGATLRGWTATCEALAAQRRLTDADVARVRLWQTYGHLIGNNDMHSRNLSLLVHDIVGARFSVAPCYDMLPMRYRPEAQRDDFGLLPLAFERPATVDSATFSAASALAQRFWRQVAAHAPCSADFRAVAHENAARIASLG